MRRPRALQGVSSSSSSSSSNSDSSSESGNPPASPDGRAEANNRPPGGGGGANIDARDRAAAASERQFLFAARMLAGSLQAPGGGAGAERFMQVPGQPQISQQQQQLPAPPHSFNQAGRSGAPAGASNPSSAFTHQAMPADLSLASIAELSGGGDSGTCPTHNSLASHHQNQSQNGNQSHNLNHNHNHNQFTSSGALAAGPAQQQQQQQQQQAFDYAAQSSLGGLMATAVARQQQQQQRQDFLSQFSSLHGLSAVASAIQSQQSTGSPHQFAPSLPFGLAHAPPVGLGGAGPQKQPRPPGLKAGGRRRRGVRKCRKVYGMAQRALWCTQCKWKKACSRFPAGSQLQAQQSQQQLQQEVSNTTNPIRRAPVGAYGPKARVSLGAAPALATTIDHAGATRALAGSASSNHLISNLLHMSASFQRLQAAAAANNFRNYDDQRP